MIRQKGPIFEFAEFRLIPAEGQLLRDGEQISLTPKALAVLTLLVEQQGQLVEKSELIEHVWQNSFVEESAVSRCIWTIRTALGEDSKDQKFIQTVPKRGYRFVADVVRRDGSETPRRDPNAMLTAVARVREEVSPASGPLRVSSLQPALKIEERADNVFDFPSLSNGDQTEPAAERARLEEEKKHRWTTSLVFGGLAAAFLVTVVAAVLFLSASSTADSAKDRARLAVLPFTPISAELRDPIYELGIADSIIARLSAVDGVSVKPLPSVRRYSELASDPIEIGKELKVDFVLSSTFQVVSGRIRVTSQLLNVATGQAEKAVVSESPIGNAFSVQDSVSNEVGNMLLERFGSTAKSVATRRGTSSEEAYRLYHRGMYLVDKGGRADITTALQLFDEAVRLDPTFARGWAGKALAHCTIAHHGGKSPAEQYLVAEPALETALALDDKLAEAYAVRGLISSDYKWKTDIAERDFHRSLELDPTVSSTHRWYSYLLSRTGRHDEALAEVDKSLDLDPASLPSLVWKGGALFQARRYQDALRSLEQTRQMEPNSPWINETLWQTYHLVGDHPSAFAAFMRQKEVTGADDATVKRFREVYDRSGWNAVLNEELAAVEKGIPAGEYSPVNYRAAYLAATAGKKDEALNYLNKCLEQRVMALRFITTNPLFDNLRGDPRFEKIKTAVGY